MRIDIRNPSRQHLFRVEVDPRNPPQKVRAPQPGPANALQGGQGLDVYLNWDQAIDDRGFLRHCPVCNCRDLYTRKNFPQITGFVIVSLAVVVSLVLLGYRQTGAALAVLGVMVAADLGIFIWARRKLVCYHCRSEFHGVPVSRDQKPWDSAIAEKYPRELPRTELPSK